jgi:phage pi2 protein 07
MPNLIVKAQDGRELQISRGGFVYYKDNEGEVNWEWQYISDLQEDMEKILKRAESMLDEVKSLLPDSPMGRIK